MLLVDEHVWVIIISAYGFIQTWTRNIVMSRQANEFLICLLPQII